MLLSTQRVGMLLHLWATPLPRERLLRWFRAQRAVKGCRQKAGGADLSGLQLGAEILHVYGKQQDDDEQPENGARVFLL
jgi:hypothetical protein